VITTRKIENAIVNYIILNSAGCGAYMKRYGDLFVSEQSRVIISGNPGCMIQLLYDDRKYDVDVNVIHSVSLLKIAYKKGKEI